MRCCREPISTRLPHRGDGVRRNCDSAGFGGKRVRARLAASVLDSLYTFWPGRHARCSVPPAITPIASRDSPLPAPLRGRKNSTHVVVSRCHRMFVLKAVGPYGGPSPQLSPTAFVAEGKGCCPGFGGPSPDNRNVAIEPMTSMTLCPTNAVSKTRTHLAAKVSWGILG